MTFTPDAECARDRAQTSIVGTTPAVSGSSRTGTADFSDQERIRDIRGCWTLAKLDALIWKRRNTTPQPTEAGRNAWREHRAKLMRAGK